MTQRMEDIGIELFSKQNNSVYNKLFRFVLKNALSLYLRQKNNKSYDAQFPSVSRNFELVFESLLNLFKKPSRFFIFTKEFLGFSLNYLGTQNKTKNDKQYLIYSNIDAKIDFKPEKDTIYLFMLANFTYLNSKLMISASKKQIHEAIGCYKKLRTITMETFKEYQTVVPRFSDHNRIGLKLVHLMERPLNCCPSNHVAYSILSDNIAEKVFNLPEKDGLLWDSTRKTTLSTVSSVLYTKQHSFIDVSFGILAAKMAFESYFPDLKFNNFLNNFEELKKKDPQIPYDEISKSYLKLEKRVNSTENTKSLSDLVYEHLVENGYPLVSPKDTFGYYDLTTKKVVRLD